MKLSLLSGHHSKRISKVSLGKSLQFELCSSLIKNLDKTRPLPVNIQMLLRRDKIEKTTEQNGYLRSTVANFSKWCWWRGVYLIGRDWKGSKYDSFWNTLFWFFILLQTFYCILCVEDSSSETLRFALLIMMRKFCMWVESNMSEYQVYTKGGEGKGQQGQRVSIKVLYASENESKKDDGVSSDTVHG